MQVFSRCLTVKSSLKKKKNSNKIIKTYISDSPEPGTV